MSARGSVFIGSLGTLLVAALLPGAVQAGSQGPDEDGSDWNLDLGLTGQYDHYWVEGDTSQGLYPFTGSQPSAELDLDYLQRFSPYKSFRVKILSLFNDSDYRSRHDGVVPERLGLVFENGGSALPYRLELGDHLAYFSQRTMERPLKGAALELQGGLGSPERRWSLQVLSGAYRDSWRGLEWQHDWTSGASLLIADPTLGTWGFHFIDSTNAVDPRNPRLHQDQTIYGLAAHKAFRTDSHTISIEGEYDHSQTRAVDDEGEPLTDEIDGNGWFAQLRGEGKSPFSFRLRYEDFERAYIPLYAPATIPDRRSGEAHVGWRFSGGTELRARVQRFEDDRETVNPRETTTIGGTLSGPIVGGPNGLNAWIDYYHQDTETEDLLIDQNISTLNVDAWKGVSGWTPRFTLFWQDFNDDGFAGFDNETLQAQIRGDGPFTLGGFRGTMGPGVMYRNISGDRHATEDWTPTFAFRLSQGVHIIETALDYQTQNRELDFGEDVDTLNFRFLYRLAARLDWIDLEFNTQYRDPAELENTKSYRASARWTHRFQTASEGRAPHGFYDGGTTRSLAPAGSGPLEFAQLYPGVAMSAVERRLEQGGAPAPVKAGDLRVWETRLLPEIDARQRFVAVGSGGLVKTTALIIEPPRGISETEFGATFDRVRQVLIDRWGRPDSVYDQGEPAQGLLDGVNRGTLIRIYEWARPEGLIRLGLPRRIDGQVRIELQFSEDFPALRDTLWGIEGVR